MGHFSAVHRFSMMMTVFFCSWQAERRQGTNAQNIQTYSNAMNRVLLAAELKIKNHAGTYMNRWDFFFFFLCKHADYDISCAGAVQKISELAFKLMLAVHCMYERLFGPLVQQDEVRERRVLMLIWGTTFKIPQILKLPFSP